MKKPYEAPCATLQVLLASDILTSSPQNELYNEFEDVVDGKVW